MLRQISEPKCYPVSVEQARQHQVIDSSDRSNDQLLELLIASATADSQMKTGRVWVECDWEWKLDQDETGAKIDFPIVPVTCVKLYDLDEQFPEPEEPSEPEEPADPDMPEMDIRETPEYTDVAAEYLDIEYPSPDPLGSPMIGSITLRKALPINYRLLLTAGYPTQEHEETVEQFDNPILDNEACCYTSNIVRLVFNRPVSGEVYVENFQFYSTTSMSEKPEFGLVPIEDVRFRDGCVELLFADMVLENYQSAMVSFAEGAIQDEFGNFVQPFVKTKLPRINFRPETALNEPEPLPTQIVFTSDAPMPIKNWILTRVGTLYSQRTEIALRAGKSNDAMFKDEFINNLLNPYQVRFL